jgi:hypothetical protein
MEDRRIKKVRISRDNLPPISADQGKYVVRYRIISNDRNRVSHWSPQFLVSLTPPNFEAAEDRNISVTVAGSTLVVRWNISAKAQAEFNKNPKLELTSYDVYLVWGDSPTSTNPIGSPTAYYATSSGNYLTVPIETGRESVRIVVQAITYPRKYTPAVAIADSGVVAL